MLINFYWTTLHHIPEDNTLHFLYMPSCATFHMVGSQSFLNISDIFQPPDKLLKLITGVIITHVLESFNPLKILWSTQTHIKACVLLTDLSYTCYNILYISVEFYLKFKIIY
jgi:hypothetical protein